MNELNNLLLDKVKEQGIVDIILGYKRDLELKEHKKKFKKTLDIINDEYIYRYKEKYYCESPNRSIRTKFYDKHGEITYFRLTKERRLIIDTFIYAYDPIDKYDEGEFQIRRQDVYMNTLNRKYRYIDYKDY